MTVTPEIPRANKEIRDMLRPFDFVVVDNQEYGPVWFDTAALEPFETVAQRSTGCVYALIGPRWLSHAIPQNCCITRSRCSAPI
jgi:hypothetical protein